MSELHIFISHKMPTDTDLATQIGMKLALYGGNGIKTVHAGQFRQGERWRERIEEELKKTDWFILLHTDPDEDWGYCLYECGYFRRTMEEGDRKKLITICRKPNQINAALQEFNAVPISENTITKLLNAIYKDEPWKIAPNLDDDTLDKTAKEIVDMFEGAERVVANFDISPSVTIEIDINNTIRDKLKNGSMPEDTYVSGTGDWQRLFGRDINTGGGYWHYLIERWQHAKVYEFLIAKMVDDALDARMPKSAHIRDFRSGDLYRLTLRRYEKLAAGKHRFYFTAGPVDMPFSPAQEKTVTTLFHLVNLSWSFRRCVIDKLYERLLEVNSMYPPDHTSIAELYDALGRGLVQVYADAIIRGLDNPLMVEQVMDIKDPQVREIFNRMKTWRELNESIFNAMSDGDKGLHVIAKNLHEMAMLNYEFYRKVAKSYAEYAQKLQPPPLYIHAQDLVGTASPEFDRADC